jgi:two-component system, cell cycle sensor histidine kinase and response regulator CckA
MNRDAETILLVDDEESDREFMLRALQAEGYTVIEAAEPRGALNLFRHYLDKIRMIVVDVSLPIQNGCDMAKGMFEQKPSLNVLFVSGHVGAEICKFYGFPVSDVHFLRKPFSAAEFTSRVRHLLENAEPLPHSFTQSSTP